ncbi:MAG: hypothetical protein L0Y71_04545 [Gemmataceae bacterium]|nr:hypothetical protein [Gemmataceae bacterium]
MAEIVVEQALFRRQHEQRPAVAARSPGFVDDWVAEAERLIDGFGARSGGVTCSLAVFAQPLGDRHVAVARVADQETGAGGWPALAFHFLVMTRADYEKYVGDPFLVGERVPPNWTGRGALPVLTWPAETLPARTVAQVQSVLKRIKGGALREDEDPEADIERTVENSESPALLGGAQVLVDGGKLVFVRKEPDQALMQGLWTLLPYSLRGKIWPASFAFTNDLGFDAVVVPRLGDGSWEGYTNEEQAADYPAGSYELALQVAAEAGDQRELDAVLSRRSSNETLRLAWRLLIVMAIVVIGGHLFFSSPEPPRFPVQRRAALAAGVVAVADPWQAVMMINLGDRLVKQDRDANR